MKKCKVEIVRKLSLDIDAHAGTFWATVIYSRINVTVSSPQNKPVHNPKNLQKLIKLVQGKVGPQEVGWYPSLHVMPDANQPIPQFLLHILLVETCLKVHWLTHSIYNQHTELVQQPDLRFEHC